MITRGLLTGKLITRGYIAGAAKVVVREVIRLVSEIYKVITGTSEMKQTVSFDSALDSTVPLISEIELEDDDG